MTTQMSCLFNTPKHSWTHSPHHHHHHHYLSYKSLFTSTQPLSSPFAPLLFLPSLSVGSHCIWRVRERGRKKGEKGRQSARERGKEGECQASGCKGECTWMGKLPGHAVRGYCPACQQPLSFNGAHISSFWLWQMTGTLGVGVEMVDLVEMYMCVWDTERKRVYWGGRWDEGEVWGQRLKNAGTPKSPIDWNPST